MGSLLCSLLKNFLARSIYLPIYLSVSSVAWGKCSDITDISDQNKCINEKPSNVTGIGKDNLCKGVPKTFKQYTDFSNSICLIKDNKCCVANKCDIGQKRNSDTDLTCVCDNLNNFYSYNNICLQCSNDWTWSNNQCTKSCSDYGFTINNCKTISGNVIKTDNNNNTFDTSNCKCTACITGYLLENNECKQIFNCAAGQYLTGLTEAGLDNNKKGTCQPCKSGYYCTGVSGLIPKNTPQGMTPCPDDYKSNNVLGQQKKEDCQISCNENYYVETANGKCDKECPPGTQSSVQLVNYGQVSSCSNVICLENQYVNSHSCTNCGNGYTSEGGTVTHCTKNCEPKDITNCKIIEGIIKKGSSEEDKTGCKCKECNIGYSIKIEDNKITCEQVKCPEGKFVKDHGCAPCPKGQTTTENNTSTSCTPISVTCEAGKYLPKGETSCSPCPEGSYCDNNANYNYSEKQDQGRTLCSTLGNEYKQSDGERKLNTDCYKTTNFNEIIEDNCKNNKTTIQHYGSTNEIITYSNSHCEAGCLLKEDKNNTYKGQKCTPCAKDHWCNVGESITDNTKYTNEQMKEYCKLKSGEASSNIKNDNSKLEALWIEGSGCKCPVGMSTSNAGSKTIKDCKYTSETKFCFGDPNQNQTNLKCFNISDLDATYDPNWKIVY